MMLGGAALCLVLSLYYLRWLRALPLVLAHSWINLSTLLMATSIAQ